MPPIEGTTTVQIRIEKDKWYLMVLEGGSFGTVCLNFDLIVMCIVIFKSSMPS